MMWGARQDPPRHWLLDGRDYGRILGLMAIGLGLRLLYFSGFGLADDPIFRGSIAQIQSQHLIWGNMTYRATWWLPTVLSCRFLGLNELGLILPITITATFGIALIYALGKTLWGTSGAIIAALLLITQPLDFAWSTMLANDIMVSFASALTVLLVLRAFAQEDAAWKCRLWIIAAVSLWIAFLAKVSALAIVPAIAVIC
jgi:4-amino-4-deoxy-L-arabinose transferase-like glycosyltransferase